MASILLRPARSGTSEVLELGQLGTNGLLRLILLELRKLNLQAEIANDEEILEEDIRDDHL